MSTPQQLIRPEILALHAYHVPPAQGMIKLDAMENPYSLPADLRQRLGEALGNAAINRYPDASSATIKQRLRSSMGIAEDQDILLGNGSDELIQILAMALAKPGAKIVSVEPSFVMYKMIAAFCGMHYIGVPLRADDFSLDIDALLATIEREQPALVFLAYPNNPTGNHFAASDIERVLQAAPGVVVVDEAYHAFARDSFLPRLPQHHNLLVMRTLSKLGLAGLRLGFLVGHPDWVQQLEKLRLPYNINALTQVATDLVLQHIEVLNQQTAEIRATRTTLFAALQALPGVKPFPSDANFILARVPDAPTLFAALKARNILIKNLHGGHPMLQHCLRFTVGTPDENTALLNALRTELDE
ncbi:MAG: histidinol-phosphate aminotransferase [Pseudomonadota bacterium]|jgi:histidinol-phosphate aminotransferase|nr:histidinol-phosphate aminotransferase [Pseudomonadota bacterium]